MLSDRLPGSLLLRIGLLLFDLCHCCVDLAFGQSPVVAVAELAGVIPLPALSVLYIIGGHAAKGSPVEVRRKETASGSRPAPRHACACRN